MGTAVAERARASAERNTHSTVLAWAPSLTSLAFVVPAVLLYWHVGGPSALLTDPNTGVHVRTGEWILAHWTIPREDLFSFTLAGHEWVDWEWLADVLFALLHHANGLAGIATLSVALLGGTAVAVYWTARLYTGRIVAIAVTCLVMAASTIHCLARPHLFSWFFLAWLLWALGKTRVSGKVKWLLDVPVVMLLWANLHPGFVAGLVVLCVWCCGEAAEAAFRDHPVDKRKCWRGVRWLAALTVFCVVLTFANPYGFRLHQHILGYLFSRSSVTGVVAEWLAPDFRNPRLHWFELLLPLCGAAGLWHGVRRQWSWCALTLGGLHVALLSVRNVPLCAILSAAPVASMIEEFLPLMNWSHALQDADEHLTRIQRRGTGVASGILALVVLSVVWIHPLDFGPRSSLPAEAMPHIPDGLLFTSDRWADYLIYAKAGQRVFVDCRSDFYGADLIRSYVMVMEARPGWERILVEHGIRLVLVPRTSELRRALGQSPKWSLGYSDRTAALFIRAHP